MSTQGRIKKMKSTLTAIIFAVSAISFSSCTNQVSSPATIKAKLTTGVSSVFSNTGSTTGLVLQTVVPYPLDSSQFNLVGDGSGDFAKYCIASAGANGGATTFSCTCSYKYTRQNGSTVGPIDANVTYREEDLIRCSHSIIHSDAVSVDVSVHLVNSDSYSNTVTLNFPSLFGGDSSNALSLKAVNRYQCRDAIFSLLPFNSSQKPIYDPFLSDDPEISYPLNFYYTNRGAALSSFVANKNANPSDAQVGSGNVKVGWNCPSDQDYTHNQKDLNLFSLTAPAAPSDIPPIASYDDSYTNTWWTNLIASAHPFLMADPNNYLETDPENQRTSFYLSKAASGVFNMPVQAYVAPVTINARVSSTDTTSFAPIGYGVAPTPQGDDQESCPSSSDATIPSGYHWVKVWLFRASLDVRKAPAAQALNTPVLQVVKDFGGSEPAGSPTSWDCAGAAGTPIVGPARDDQSNRVSQNYGCFNPRISGLAGPAFDNTIASAAFTPTAATTYDKWRMGIHSGALIPADYTDLTSWFISFQGWINPALHQAAGIWDDVPQKAVTFVPMEKTSRYDYLFVVTPTNVHSKHMIYPNTSNYENVGKFFTPYRIRNSSAFVGACSSTNASSCDEYEKINYEIKLHAVQYQGDAPNPLTDPGRLPVFPVCALQKDKP